MEKNKSTQLHDIDNVTRMESILKLTEYKEYIPLTQSLLSELHSINNIHNVKLYEIVGDLESTPLDTLMLKDVLHILCQPIPFYDVVKSYSQHSSGQLAQPILEEEILQTVFPIQSNAYIQRILVIDWSNLHPDNWKYILKSIEIYSNLLNIIDEKDRDRLTGLLNRHTFDNNLENILGFSKLQSKTTRGSNENSWIAILDIDHFKRINDNFGHIMGDEVLLLFSRCMLSSFRYSDIIFRFGGEEFIVVLTGCNKQGVEAALNRFRENIEHYPFPQVGQVTVSAGYIFLDTSHPPNILLDRADQALYHAKETGRNKVVYYQDIAQKLAEVEQVDNIELF